MVNKPIWNDRVCRVREWLLVEEDRTSYWKCQLAEINLDDVVMVRVMEEMPAGHWAVQVVLRTIPTRLVVVDGNLDNWWYENDVRLKAQLKGGNGGRTGSECNCDRGREDQGSGDGGSQDGEG